MKLVDAHCHLHELSDNELLSYCNTDDLKIIAVADDLISSLKTLKISKRCSNVVPSVGVHPWVISKVDEKEIDAILEIAASNNVRFLGEVGIDKRFVPQTYDLQVDIFKKLIEYASSNGLGVNVHAAGAWDDALKILFKYDVKVAIIHWYTGPIELLNDLRSVGYFITVNPAVKVQLKSRDVVHKAPLDIILTESDSPYIYRGMRLTPEKVLDAAREIALIKGIELEDVVNAILTNYLKVLNSIGL
ncbi:MAG: TatD family hydrolase [Sulfolobales archaeon]